MNTHVKSRTLYFTRHGESQYNLKHLIGGDSLLSERGLLYSDKLKKYFDEHVPAHRFASSDICQAGHDEHRGLVQQPQAHAADRPALQDHPSLRLLYVWRRSAVQSFKALDELDVGDGDGMTYEQTEVLSCQYLPTHLTPPGRLSRVLCATRAQQIRDALSTRRVVL
jgi:broad specificity phosphatase PhoE